MSSLSRYWDSKTVLQRYALHFPRLPDISQPYESSPIASWFWLGVGPLLPCRRSRDYNFLDLVFLTSSTTTAKHIALLSTLPPSLNSNITLNITQASAPPWISPTSEPTLDSAPASPSWTTNSQFQHDMLTLKTIKALLAYSGRGA